MSMMSVTVDDDLYLRIRKCVSPTVVWSALETNLHYIVSLLLLYVEWFCRYSRFGGYQCFCPWGLYDVRPMNGTNCVGKLSSDVIWPTVWQSFVRIVVAAQFGVKEPFMVMRTETGEIDLENQVDEKVMMMKMLNAGPEFVAFSLPNNSNRHRFSSYLLRLRYAQ